MEGLGCHCLFSFVRLVVVLLLVSRCIAAVFVVLRDIGCFQFASIIVAMDQML
jgi:hypothetical protein